MKYERCYQSFVLGNFSFVLRHAPAYSVVFRRALEQATLGQVQEAQQWLERLIERNGTNRGQGSRQRALQRRVKQLEAQHDSAN